MTNLLNLPQMPAGTTINIVSNCDWDDQFFVPVAGPPSAPIVLTGALATNTLTVAAAGAVTPGMLAQGLGIPPKTTVTAVTPTVITLSNAATIAAPGATVTFLPPPLDLTGISFSSTLRTGIGSLQAILSLSTGAGTMTNGGTQGMFGWSVPGSMITNAPFPAPLKSQGTVSCVVDIVATDATGALVNLCALNGPIPVNVSLSVTR